MEKLALVFPHLGVIYLLHQLCVFVDEPCFPEYIGGCVLHLRSENADDRRVTVAAGGAENRTTASLIALHMYICTKDTFLFSMGALLKQKKKTPNVNLLLSLTLLQSCVSIMKLWTCFSALVSSSFRATTATTRAVQPAPCGTKRSLSQQRVQG